MEDLLAGQFTLTASEAADSAKALELQHQHGLLINDSLNLAAGLRYGTNLLATCDPQFDTVTGLTVFKPDDVT